MWMVVEVWVMRVWVMGVQKGRKGGRDGKKRHCIGECVWCVCLYYE